MLVTLVDWLAAAFLVVGTLFMMLGAVAIVRMPDVYMRLQVSSKAATMGIGAMALGAAVHFGSASVAARCLALVAFAALTVPVAAHALGFAAHRADLPMWHGTGADELREAEAEAEARGEPPADGRRPECEER